MSIWSRFFGRPTPAADAALAIPKEAADGMINLITKMGTPRDPRTGGVYGPPKVLGVNDLDNMYRGSWLAGKIIDIPVDDMTRMGWTRKWSGSDKDTASMKKVTDAEALLGVYSKVTSQAKWGRAYGEAYLVPVIRGQKLNEPLVLDSVKEGMLQNFLDFDCFEVVPNPVLDTDPASPNAKYPLSYRWTQEGLDIHWSRIIKFGGRDLPYRVKRVQQYRGDSILKRVCEVVMNYDAAEGGVASLILEAKIDVLALRGLRQELAKTGGEDRIQVRIQTALLMKSIWNALVVDAGDGGAETGDRFDQKQIAFGNLDKILDRLGQSVAGAADIPMTRLFAMSPGGQNSTGESDDDNYDDHIAALQRTQLAPRLNQIDQLMIRSTLGKMPDDYELCFNPLTQMDPKQQAEIRKLDAEADQIYLTEGVVTENLVARELQARGTYQAMEQKDVNLTSNEIEEPAEPVVPVPVDPAKVDPPVA